MVLRTARRGANQGNQFWGCSTFPKCRNVVALESSEATASSTETRIDAAHVEHIVPKIFAYFDISKSGKAVQGIRYKSLLHRLDNLQASHTYCNKNKGNTADVTRWRHPTMPPLAVALAEDGAEFRVPREPVQGH